MLDHHPPFTVITVPCGAVTQHRQEQFARRRLRCRSNGGRSVLGRTAEILVALLVMTVVLAGCEEWFVEKKPAAKPQPKPDPPAPTYTEADMAAIQSRWQGAMLAFAAGGSAGRLSAASTESIDWPEEVTVKDARTYGACDVFTLVIQVEPEYPAVRAAIIDCVDRAEQRPGMYHAALLCPVEPAAESRGVVIRAGDRNRLLPEEHTYCSPDGTYCRDLSLSAHGDGNDRRRIERVGYTHRGKLGYRLVDGDYEAIWVDVRWALRGDREIHDLMVDAVSRGSGALPFSIEWNPTWTWGWEITEVEWVTLDLDSGDPDRLITDEGVAKLKENDKDAAAEYTSRCSRAR